MSRIAFIGAGSVEFTRQLVADLLRFDDIGPLHLALHDVDPRRLAVAEQTARAVSAQLDRPLDVSAHTDRREALTGAIAVVVMIQVGGLEATLVDLELPATYGLRQAIGDTTGVGGVFRGLRTFPALEAIAADMRVACPDAWLLNYTNPMAMNVWWLSKVAPDIKTVGLCHSVYWTAHDLGELIGVDAADTHFRAAGVNHQAWLLEWTANGEDLYPRLRDAIAADPGLERRVRVEMFRRFGYYPTETSEHSSEYLSWFWRDDAQVERFRLTPMEYAQISRDNVAEFERTEQRLAAGEPLDLEEGASEYAPVIIHSLITGTKREIHGNVINNGLIDNLPQGAGVEVPCLVDGDGVHPIPMGALPLQCAAPNRTFLSVAEMTVNAALTGDPTMVRQAVLADPNASSTLTPEQIWRLCDELTLAHGNLLPPALRTTVEGAP